MSPPAAGTLIQPHPARLLWPRALPAAPPLLALLPLQKPLRAQEEHREGKLMLILNSGLREMPGCPAASSSEMLPQPATSSPGMPLPANITGFC